jgi:hypothetical protein
MLDETDCHGPILPPTVLKVKPTQSGTLKPLVEGSTKPVEIRQRRAGAALQPQSLRLGSRVREKFLVVAVFLNRSPQSSLLLDPIRFHYLGER